MEASHPDGQYLLRNGLRFFLQKQSWGKKKGEKKGKYDSLKDQNILNTPCFTSLVTAKRKQLESKDKKTPFENIMEGDLLQPVQCI